MIAAYLDEYSPAIPVFQVYLSATHNEDWRGSFTAIVDAGADFTIIPKQTLASIEQFRLVRGYSAPSGKIGAL